MAVQQAGGNTDPRIYALDKGLDYPDLGGDEIWVHECESFTLAYQDGEFRVFEDLETEYGAMELFEICVEIEGTAGSDLGIEIEVPMEESWMTGFVSVVVNLEKPTEEQEAEFSAKLLEAVRAGARAELGRSF